jgi:IMP dehydrogenase
MNTLEETCVYFRDKFPNIVIVAGNVVTPDATYKLIRYAGVNIVKIGIGPGSACITRMMTGMGIPQFTAIQDCYQGKLDMKTCNKNVYLIADGGIKNPRDAVLALAAGADGVMMGSVFARTFESASVKRKFGYKIYGRYRGQASNEFMNNYIKSKRQAEGVGFDVQINKSAMDVFDEYEGGLRSALTYCGTSNLEEFRKNAELFESTGNYMKESNYREL